MNRLYTIVIKDGYLIVKLPRLGYTFNWGGSMKEFALEPTNMVLRFTDYKFIIQNFNQTLKDL